MQINLFGSNDTGLSVNIQNAENQNCYEVASPKGRSGTALIGSPGTAIFSSTTGEMRGCCGNKPKPTAVYFVVGTALYGVDQFGVETNLGVIPGTGRVSMVSDGTSVIIVNGTDTAYFYNAGLTAVSLPFVAHSVTMSDTYAIFASSGQRWFISNVGDTDAFDSLDFSLAQALPDDILTVISDHSEVMLCGTKSIQPAFNSGNVDFPFEYNVSGNIERGFYGRWAWAKDDNTIFFLGDDLIVYRLQGYTPIRISDDDTETRLSKLRREHSTDLENAFAFTYTDHGHKFLQLTVPNRLTLVYDVATQQWHTKKHWNYETHHAACYIQAYGKHLVGCLSGNICEMSSTYYDDEGIYLKRLRRTSVLSVDDRLINWKKLKIEFEFGTTPLLSGQGSDPKAVLRWSRNFGRTWSNERTPSLGVQGNYTAKAIERNLGKDRARIYEFYVTDPVPFFVTAAYVTIS